MAVKSGAWLESMVSASWIVVWWTHVVRVDRESPKKEVWGKHNVFTNNIEAPSYMVNLPENGPLKTKIFEGVRPILEEWSGVSHSRWTPAHVKTSEAVCPRPAISVGCPKNLEVSLERRWRGLD